MSETGEEDEGVAPGHVVIVGVEEPVAVPTHPAENAQGQCEKNGWNYLKIRTRTVFTKVLQISFQFSESGKSILRIGFLFL